MSGKQVALYALLLLLAAVSGWRLLGQDSSLERKTVSETGPDAFVVDMDLRVMNEQGRLDYRIKALRMTHYPNDKLFRLVQPDIRILRSNGDRWRIRSEKGETTEETDIVWLLGAVDIQRPASQTGSKLHIVTSDLKVLTDAEIAETEQEATITSEEFTINTVGMKADFSNATLELRSRVRGRYDVSG